MFVPRQNNATESKSSVENAENFRDFFPPDIVNKHPRDFSGMDGRFNLGALYSN